MVVYLEQRYCRLPSLETHFCKLNANSARDQCHIESNIVVVVMTKAKLAILLAEDSISADRYAQAHGWERDARGYRSGDLRIYYVTRVERARGLDKFDIISAHGADSISPDLKNYLESMVAMGRARYV